MGADMILMWSLLITLAAAAQASQDDLILQNYVLSDNFIAETNKQAGGLWKAERTFHPHTSHNYLSGLMGSLNITRTLKVKSFAAEDLTDLPFHQGCLGPGRMWILLGLWSCVRHVRQTLHSFSGQSQSQPGKLADLLLQLRLRLQWWISRQRLEVLAEKGTCFWGQIRFPRWLPALRHRAL